MTDLSNEIYSILVSRQFRQGSLPSVASKELVLNKIKYCVERELPIKIFQFWGGAKNPNLPILEAELSEEATLKQLFKVHQAVQRVYPAGLTATIFPGDERIHQANRVPHESTQIYVRSLAKLTEPYEDRFEVLPVSELYKRYHNEFQSCLKDTFNAFGAEIYKHPNFEKLAANARKNIYLKDLDSENQILERSREAAQRYIVYRVAEEKARIFRDYEDCIRFAFIKLSLFFSFYEIYLHPVDENHPHMKCALHFYTGCKGNITQPWQAIGKELDGKILFMSTNRK